MPSINTRVFRGTGAMFSNVWHVVGFVYWCNSNGFVPIVDLQTVQAMNFWSGRFPRNSWTEYFQQVSKQSLSQTLQSEKYEVFSERPNSFPVSEYSVLERYRTTFRDSIKLSDRAEAFVAPWLEYLAEEGKVLGVHMRGTDMKVAKSHLAPPTNFQMFTMIDRALDIGKFDAIFVASEDAGSLAKIHSRYGRRLLTSDSFRTRTSKKLTRMESPVLQWPLILGFQVIRDTWMLAHCDGLVSGHSNVSEHAQVIKETPFSVNYQIRRPRVDIFGSSRSLIRITNLLREISVSRRPGSDFKVIDRSGLVPVSG